MLFKSLRAVNPLFCSNRGLYKFTDSYERRKNKIYQLKMRQNFKVDPSALVSEKIIIDALVPNFFINQLTLQKIATKETPDHQTNNFLNSYARINLELASRSHLRQKLNKLFANQVRLGRIFELMDSIAGIVSYSHCYGGYKPGNASNPMICVTGSVQSLHLFDKIRINQDLVMQGYLNHVGKTSMEIQINVFQENKLKANSLFTMIARDANDPSKGYRVPSLSFEGLSPQEQKRALTRQEHAKQNIFRRKLQMSNSYDRRAPTEEQIQEIHKIFLKRKGKQLINSSQMTCPIASTSISICELMHTQNRNFHGKVFGGFLIKEMIELGWVAACKYAEEEIMIEDLTNIYFKNPVDIGCRLTLKAMVTYVEQDRIIITVEAYTSKFTQKVQKLACYLHLVGKVTKTLQKVHPESYEQSLQYLSSRKAFQELFH